jgi:diadenosine tetraphosphate (Ap4A) HIT family hydrolase
LNDQYYPGYTLVIAKTHATELYHLPENESIQYCQDMLRVAKAIATVFQPRKMNYELLGNTVAHLHWHLIPRYGWDSNPQRPIWEYAHAPKVLSLQEYAETIAAIRRALS